VTLKMRSAGILLLLCVLFSGADAFAPTPVLGRHGGSAAASVRRKGALRLSMQDEV
jgi:hypothetical protein